MERTDEKLFMLRNRRTGAWLCKVDFGKKPAEPIDADAYRAPKLFAAGECEAYCTVAGISADDYEIVPVRIVEEPAKADREVLIHGRLSDSELTCR